MVVTWRGWSDWQCSTTVVARMNCACHFPSKPFLLLRGLCQDSHLETLYLPDNRPSDGQLMFFGLSKSRIDHVGRKWHLKTAENTTATSGAGKVSFLLGKHTWRVEGDHPDCHGGVPYTTQLKLTGCREGEFTCSDGQCVAMEQRCDQLPDCRDKSDEKNCQLMVIDDSYNKKVPPIGNKDGKVLPAKVNVTIVLKDIIEIEETRHKISFKFSIRLKWYENRAQFYNLKQRASLNALSQTEIESMWLPFVIYDNTDQNEAVKLAEDVDTTVTVSKEGSFTRSGINVADEIEIFEGNPAGRRGGNPVEMRQTYSKEFKCEYQLHRYPFDIQYCSIDMVVMELEKTSTMLIPGQIIMQSQEEMTMYVITTHSIQYKNASNPYEGIKMQITLKRRIINELLTTYLPSVLLILITYSTTFFKPYYFEAALTVNLTTMLVVTTLFIAVMDKLPSTAYVKFVDIWLIFGQLIPFTTVCLLTAMEYYRDGDGSGQLAINQHGQPRLVAAKQSDVGQPSTRVATEDRQEPNKAWAAEVGRRQDRARGHISFIAELFFYSAG